ncbi:MAG: class I SAM-dependent methyltransferase [Brachybacterium sp.]|nr:class I SAM-dependent methyltransferase [Brachybacterium sp.]MDN5899324.1 class I SAM-dependent methyltransferase [Brachybacterium sp.]
MQRNSSDRDFADYNAAQAERGVRPSARRAASVALAGPIDRGLVAVELGSGAGVEARYLAESGFAVHTYDVDPSIEADMACLAQTLPIVHSTGNLEEMPALPVADLVLSCATLSFVRRAAFPTLWRRIRDALRPGGILAVDLFGVRDEWAGTDGTFLDRAEVEGLLNGLEVIELVEEEREGHSLHGPKHWHTHRILARRPEDPP